MNHDIVTIGASAGGVEVLLDLVRELPHDLDAAVFVVVHVPATHASELPDLLSRRGPLPARHPLHGEKIERGTIYVAPADNHLQVGVETIEVVRGPKDNGHRPAVDVLFRTAAMAYGSRVIGVVLSGYQDCGTAGMMSIKARGGIGIVQEPSTAQAQDMPRNVITRVQVDHIAHPLELASLISKLVPTPAGATFEPTSFVRQIEGSMSGQPVPIVCPICEGALTEAQPGVFQHFRCHVGHAFTLEALVNEQTEEMERVLWAAIRALEESAGLSERISAKETGEMRRRFAEKARTQLQQADYIRQMVLHGLSLSQADAPLASGGRATLRIVPNKSK